MTLEVTSLLREEDEVERRLVELGLNKEKLLKVRDAARGAAADATPFHPANAAGTFAYQYGTFALRSEFASDGWEAERPNGVEAIGRADSPAKVVFANVDVACDRTHAPKARSSKGAGSERLCEGNLFGDDLPAYFSSDTSDNHLVYYLMVALDGAVELSRPIVRGGNFDTFVERIFLSDGADVNFEPIKALDDTETATSFDPQIARK